jgi:hypothetical protein
VSLAPGRKTGKTETWEENLLRPVAGFVGAVFGWKRAERPCEAPRPLPVIRSAPLGIDRRALPFDLFLTLGAGSIRIYQQGTIDEFRFFQRRGVSHHHDVEFVTRLDPGDAGTENYKEFAVFKLGGESQALPDLARAESVTRTLPRIYGLERLPAARKLAAAGFSAFDPRHGHPDQGWNRLTPTPSTKPLRKVGETRFTYTDVLDILRKELSGPEKIAWIEEAFPAPPPHSRIVHRYYMDSNRQAYLVRDHATEGKRLFLAETSEDAILACRSSGKHVRRFKH